MFLSEKHVQLMDDKVCQVPFSSTVGKNPMGVLKHPLPLHPPRRELLAKNCMLQRTDQLLGNKSKHLNTSSIYPDVGYHFGLEITARNFVGQKCSHTDLSE